MEEPKYFPKGFASWHETHFEMAQAIALELQNEPTGVVKERYEQYGMGEMYDLAQELTDKFEEEFKDTEWGIEFEYYEKIEEFIQRELY